MTSICVGCAHEQACGHAEVMMCANRAPAKYCICDLLLQTRAERDKYYEAACYFACLAHRLELDTEDMCCCGYEYCEDVIKVVEEDE